MARATVRKKKLRETARASKVPTERPAKRPQRTLTMRKRTPTAAKPKRATRTTSASSPYRFLPTGEFAIRQYHATPEFASFLPGIAGPWGRPLWVFYVNRGQGVASFGLRDKEHAMMEFQSANKAYQLTTTQGFRTFIKIGSGKSVIRYEPFRAVADGVTQELRVTSDALALEETSTAAGLRTRVRYFTLPNEPMAALVRVVTVTNCGATAQSCELLDGMAAVVPYGSTDQFLKHMGRTLQAWYTVGNLPLAPVFRLVCEPNDRPEVVPITEGNFYAAWSHIGGTCTQVPTVVEPERVFGAVSDLSVPAAFWSATQFTVPTIQFATNRTPVAMAHAQARLAPGESMEVISIMGHTLDEQKVNSYVQRVTPDFIQAKATENHAIVSAVQDRLLTVTNSKTFDLYTRQTFLDNVLRGGFPIRIGTDADAPLTYIYGRKHGDLERDYNRFALEPTPWSQGNANYRDVNQNRRSDGWIEPAAVELNLLTFLNLVQLDGFNPLVYTGVQYCVTDHDFSVLDSTVFSAELIEALRVRVGEAFTPGQLSLWLDAHGVVDCQAQATAIAAVIQQAERVDTADHGEGFWSDHWHYTIDLLDSLAELFPERIRRRLLDESNCTFYDNAHVVMPRRAKYVLEGGQVRQLHAVQRDPEKARLMCQRERAPHVVRTQSGHGAVFHTTMAVKLLSVFANKIASLDPGGVGIEMEAGKPNWYDALNGLPAMCGSSVSETFELARGLRWLQTTLRHVAHIEQETLACPIELAEFCRLLLQTFEHFLESHAADRDTVYWNDATTAKELYRESTKMGVAGKTTTIPLREVDEWLTLARRRVECALPKAFDAESSTYYSYFWYEPTSFEVLGPEDSDQPVPVNIHEFARHELPLFLEGNVHAMRYELDPQVVRALHTAVTTSPLFDQQLKMYKVTTSLVDAPEAIGRARIFERGWLEHESIWLHMEYKYLLELLRKELAPEFFAAWETAGIPQQPLKRYGRSVAESSSFIVSSAYPDARMHGQGYVARLTGATAEFVHFWRFLFIGTQPFTLTTGQELACTLRPQLLGTMFTDTETSVTFTRRDGSIDTVRLPADTISVLLFGQTLVTYHNPTRGDTFGVHGVRPVAIKVHHDVSAHRIEGDTIPAPYARMLREGALRCIEVELG